MAKENHASVIGLMRDVLSASYTSLQVERVVIEEDLAQGVTSVTCEVAEEVSGAHSVIAGKGVGVIDALFRGVKERFAQEYPSLNTVRFANFSVAAQMDTKQDYAGADSQAQVTIEIANSEGRPFRFSHASRSITAASIVTTLRALEYFINSERAFVTLYHAREDAVSRNRPDLVQRYTDNMAILVQNTSYSQVISKLTETLEGDISG